MKGDTGTALSSYVCQPVWRSRCHCLLSRWPWSRLWWRRWWPDPPLWRSHGLRRNLIKFRPLRYDWSPLLVCGLRGLVTSEMEISVFKKIRYIFRADVNQLLKEMDPTIFPRLVNPTAVHRYKKPCFSSFFSPGISLSGPFLLEISVKSLRMRAAFLASDFRLDGIGLLTADERKTGYLKAETISELLRGEINTFRL